MKKALLSIAVATVLSTTSALATTLESDDQKLSYSFGLMIAKQMKPSFEQLDVEAFSAAINDVYKGATLQLDDEAVEASLKKFEGEQIALQQKQAAKAAEAARLVAEQQAKANIELGEKFLVENAKREGVTTTSSGLQIEITKPGEGKGPSIQDTVVVHYKGTSISGSEFDSSYKRNKPATFPLNGVIAGWTEGLQLIGEGGKATLYIPSTLAYGNQGAGADIGPGETLIFEVELIEIVRADTQQEMVKEQKNSTN
ncbi:MAG: FKBP-type peptidyl-prolyl cis-trans isomerase [Oceanospirillaceae bacterium]|nr:FKBP-type peptidyl-prolyl cis-trans isomerase [Oceanospirillaceae bacterium]